MTNKPYKFESEWKWKQSIKQPNRTPYVGLKKIDNEKLGGMNRQISIAAVVWVSNRNSVVENRMNGVFPWFVLLIMKILREPRKSIDSIRCRVIYKLKWILITRYINWMAWHLICGCKYFRYSNIKSITTMIHTSSLLAYDNVLCQLQRYLSILIQVIPHALTA